VQPIRSSPGFAALAEARRQEREELIALAKAYAERLRSRLPGARVFLYGSVARGDFNLASDIDLLVVSDALPANPLERAAFLYRIVEAREEPKGLLAREYDALEAAGKLWHLEGALEL
jgi:predicted nucleotidyltransferase